MKRCPKCGSTFHDRVDYCFRDGEVLAAVPVEAPPEERPTEVVAPLDLSPDPGSLDAPAPMGLRAKADGLPAPSYPYSGEQGRGGGYEDAFDAPDPSFAPSPRNFGVPGTSPEALPEPTALPAAPALKAPGATAPLPGSEFDEGLTHPGQAAGTEVPDPSAWDVPGGASPEVDAQEAATEQIEAAYDLGLAAETAPFPIPPRRSEFHEDTDLPSQDDPASAEDLEDKTGETEPLVAPIPESTGPTEPASSFDSLPPYAEPEDRGGKKGGVMLIVGGVIAAAVLLLIVGVVVLGGGITATTASRSAGDAEGVAASTEAGAASSSGKAVEPQTQPEIVPEPELAAEPDGTEAVEGGEDGEGAVEDAGTTEAGTPDAAGTDGGAGVAVDGAATGTAATGAAATGAAATGAATTSSGTAAGSSTGSRSNTASGGSSARTNGASSGSTGSGSTGSGSTGSGSTGTAATSSGSSSASSTAAATGSTGTADAAGDPWGMPTEAVSGSFSIISTPPGAMVYVDNRVVGKAPTTTSQPYGLHTVRVELDGYKTDARTVDLQTSSMAVPFELRAVVVTGKVNILGGAGTSGAALFVDGARVGQLPGTANLSEGTHSFKVELPDGTSFTRVLNIRFEVPGRPVTVTLESP